MLTLIPPAKHCTVQDKTLRRIPRSVYTQNEAWKPCLDAFCDSFEKGFGVRPSWGQGGIEAIPDPSVAKNAYRLTTDETLQIRASTTEGLSYALATVLQLCAATGSGMALPKLDIEDYPDKDYRAMMVDLGREWHPFDKLLKFVDLCFFYKVRYLNLHFADSRLYTLPSKAFPKLCKPGKHYTEEQIVRLRRYAEARGVILIPEFECPGHAPVLNENYPEVFADRSEGEGGVFYNETGEVISNKSLLCASRESAVDGVKTLLAEICDLFPDAPYLHIGGDEANIALWNQCSDCRAYMQRHGIKDVHALYSDYVARIASYVLSLGKTPMVWEGFPQDGADKIPPETIVFSWENYYQTTTQLLDEGFRIVNASWKPLYLVPALCAPHPEINWNAKDILNWNVHYWEHWWDPSVAKLNPITVPPTDQVLGSMLCSWEMTFEQEIHLMMAHLPAMAERAWSVRRERDYEAYLREFRPLNMLAARILQDR